MKRSVIEGRRCASAVPDFAALHPGYGLELRTEEIERDIKNAQRNS